MTIALDAGSVTSSAGGVVSAAVVSDGAVDVLAVVAVVDDGGSGTVELVDGLRLVEDGTDVTIEVAVVVAGCEVGVHPATTNTTNPTKANRRISPSDSASEANQSFHLTAAD